MELFDEVVIEGTGENSRLVAKDTVEDKAFVLKEGDVIASEAPFGLRDSVVIVSAGMTEIRSREIFTDLEKAKALAAEIAGKASEVSKAKYDARLLVQVPPGL